MRTAQSQTDVALVRRLRAGDGDAFERLFRLHCQPLISFVRRYVRDPSVAEGLVQDVFLAVWARRSELDPTRNIKTYLYTAAKNQALKYFRHSEVERRSTEALAAELPRPKTVEDERREKEIAASVYQAIEALPEKCRIIFTMNRYDRLTYAEIAEIQEISVKTVETQMGRALKSLRERLAYLL